MYTGGYFFSGHSVQRSNTVCFNENVAYSSIVWTMKLPVYILSNLTVEWLKIR